MKYQLAKLYRGDRFFGYGITFGIHRMPTIVAD